MREIIVVEGEARFYTVCLFTNGRVTELRIWAESLAVALDNGRTLKRANKADEFILIRENE